MHENIVDVGIAQSDNNCDNNNKGSYSKFYFESLKPFFAI